MDKVISNSYFQKQKILYLSCHVRFFDLLHMYLYMIYLSNVMGKISSKFRTFYFSILCLLFIYYYPLFFVLFLQSWNQFSNYLLLRWYNYEEFVIKFKGKLTLTTTSLNIHYWSRPLLMYRFSNSSPEIGNFSQFVKEELHRKE